MALLTQLQMVGTLVFLARAAVLVCTASDGGDSWKLNMLTVTAEKIEGTFLTPNRGIHFLSEAYGDSQRFSVVTIDGNQIIFAERKDKSATLVSLAEKDFLLVNKFIAGSTVMDYVVPPALSRQIKDSLRGRRITQKLLRHLDRSGVNATRDDAFKELIMRPEVELIVAAAKALGNTGLRGRRSPAAMTFYVFAKQLAMVKMHELGSLVGEGGESGFDERLLQHYQRREKRSREYCDNIPSGIFFSNDRYCPRGECPVGDKCLGMCGPQCSVCWDYWFICDDCCFHRGCYDHDLCCGRDGYLSWSCLTVVFDFDCDRYDCSQRCDPNPCLNGGTCIEEAGSFRCNCTNQFAGSICRRRRWCVPDPCQNGGRCIEDTDGFRCMCTPQYNGNTCGLRRWCVPDPCQNGGTCIEEAHTLHVPARHSLLVIRVNRLLGASLIHVKMVESALKDSQSLTALNGLTALQDMQSLTALKVPIAQKNQNLTALKRPTALNYTQLSLALVHQNTLGFNVSSLTIATLTPVRMGGIAYYLVMATGATVKGQRV